MHHAKHNDDSAGGVMRPMTTLINGRPRETAIMVDSNRRFTSDEVSAIVRRGLEHQSGSGDISLLQLWSVPFYLGSLRRLLGSAVFHALGTAAS